MAAHPGADDRNLADALVGEDGLGDSEALERLHAGAQVVACNRERQVGLEVIGDRLVLDDHVDVDVRVGERGEDAARDTGLVVDAGQRDARLLGVGDSGDKGALHRLVLGEDEGTGAVLERASAMDANPMVSRVLDGAKLEDPGPGGRHLEHLLEGDDGELAGVGNDPRIGAEHAGHVGVDLADAGAEGRGERDRGGVRAAAPERRHVAALGRDSLEAGDEDDPVLAESVADPVSADVEDPRLRMSRVGHDAGLRAGQRDCSVAEVVDGHRAQRARDPLPDRQQHVELARVWPLRHLARHRDQVVGRLSARRQHGDDMLAALARGHDPPRGTADVVGSGDRRATELHNDDLALHRGE